MSDRRRGGDRRRRDRPYLDKRRTGDERPYRATSRIDLACWPTSPIRWLPRHGDPYCVLEWVSQWTIRSLASLPIYTAVIVTITLALAIWLVH